MTETNKYAYPKVGPFGLCHSLLAWARAVAWADENQAKLIAPNWSSIRGRVGPIIRQERDKRQYQRLFHFPRYINGFKKLYLLNSSILVPMNTHVGPERFEPKSRCIFVFENLISNNEETYFHEIVGKQTLIKNELISITKQKYLPSQETQKFIAIHVRRGDFQKHTSSAFLENGSKNSCIPISWFVSMLNDIRAFLNYDIPAIVYSDGSTTELKPLLSLPNTKRSPYKASITDLLYIGASKLLLSSGSGFSMWGAYLGSTPRICYPGQKFCSVLQPNPKNFETEALRFADVSKEDKKCISKMFLCN